MKLGIMIYYREGGGAGIYSFFRWKNRWGRLFCSVLVIVAETVRSYVGGPQRSCDVLGGSVWRTGKREKRGGFGGKMGGKKTIFDERKDFLISIEKFFVSSRADELVSSGWKLVISGIVGVQIRR